MQHHQQHHHRMQRDSLPQKFRRFRAACQVVVHLQLLQDFLQHKCTRIQVFQQTRPVRQVMRRHLLLQDLQQRRCIKTQISRRVLQVHLLLPICSRCTAQHRISSTLQTNSYPLINNTPQIRNTRGSNSRKARTKGNDQGSSGSLRNRKK
jgi:hypothetical protein